MSENTVVQDGANLPVGWNDLSALDQSVFYPADMSALPTSTPNPAKLRRKSRRSWFDATPKGFKFDIAVEKPEMKKPRPKSETVEVLTLTHFTAAPRLGFGTMKLGQERTCTLLLRNPHDYEQSVKLEKVPEKKNFSVPCKEFTVGPEESYPLEITWCPKEAGGCREMVLMQIDNAYRLQAYVFGTVTAPPPQKKKGKRVGLLASKVARPFSVIHTTSLANINHDYSPEKKTGTLSSRQTNLKVKKPGTQSKGPVLHTQSRAKIGTVTKARKSEEVKAGRRSARLSGKFESDTKENSENIDPDTESKRLSGSLEREGRKSNERKAVLKREEKNQRKKMRRSNTYSNVSGAGLPIPIIQGETVKGLKDTSMINDCNISGIEMLPDHAIAVNVDVVEICKSSVDVPLGLAPKLQGELVTKNYDSEPSFLENPRQYAVKDGVTDEPSFLEVHEQCLVQTVVVDEPSFLQDHITSVQTNYENLEPSFLEHMGQNMGKNPVLTGLQNIEKYSDSLEPENQSLEDPSFLQPDTKKPNKPRRSLRKRSGIQELGQENQPTGVKLLRSAKRNKARSTEVSPESFLKENKIRNVPELEPANEHKPLNDSVGQSSILEQLQHLKSFVHDRSLEIEKSGGESFHEADANVEELQRRETFVKQNISRFSMPGTEANIRRGTFVTGPSKIKIIETQQPSEASPRRTTFTVVKTAEVNKPVRQKVDVTVNVVLEEDENSVEEIEEKVPSNVDNTSKMSEEQCTLLENKGRIFSQDSLDNGSFEKQTESPQQIFSENIEVFTRRSTLTVTKSRPSDALLEHAQRSGAHSTRLFKSENAITSILEDVRGDVEPDMNKSCTPLQNSTFEVPLEDSIIVRNSSFPSTPHCLLPNSPLLNDSKRSTHIIEKPKVVDLSKIGTKQLFIKEAQTDEKPESDKDEIGHDKEQSDKIDKADGVEIASPPSANTRRRLSARRSVTTLRKSTERAEEVTVHLESAEVRSGKHSEPRESTIYDNEVVASEEPTDDEPLDETEVVSKTSGRNESENTVEAGQLLFIPLDTKPLSEAPTRPLVQRPNPNQFLKKRSNPIAQEVDRRCKRTKSDSVALNLQPCEQKTFVSQQAPLKPTRVPRQTIKSTGSVNDVSRRQVLKPKAGVAKGLAQSKLILSKKSKSAVPRLPLAFAAKNMFYDERWMEKQERGFVNWLNFILTPADEHQSSDVKVKVDAGKLTLDVEKGRNRLAPTNEILSFRTYSAQRKLNRLRKSACRLFQSDAVRRVMQKLEAEVESNRLLVRKDKMLHADLGAKQKILDMLLSYNPLWLRVGLETIYGEMVPLQSNNDVYGLSRFIILRLLVSPDIADEYAHPTVPHLYRDGYAQASAQYTLKKFLMLVYFLDQAKQNRLIDHNPCLFCKDSDLKATKDFLLQFSRDFLSGEGDITKHLGYLGYKVTYSQTALDEFDFAVQKLAVDLRDGIRLTRVLEILCSRPDLGKTLRAPAISRLQKIHNVELVFKELTKQKIDPGTVNSRDVVDGHREKTLSLLWTIILQYQVAMVINLDQLKEEIQILERSLRLRNKFDKLINLDNGISTRRESAEKDLHTQDERLNLLLKWCRAVCAFSNIKIENFTVSFSDGRALCHILHYYHPGLAPLTDIQHETTMTHVESMENKCLQNQNCSLNDSVNSSAVFGEMEDPAVYEKLLANEKENFKLLSEKVKELGGVPMMLRWSDMSNTIPDEKVVVTYLMYLCARLLDIRHESRAARVIQHAWKSYRLRKMQAELKEKSRVIVVLQRAVRAFLSRRREKKQQSAAVTVQKYWRGRCARKSVERLRQDRIMEQQLHAVKLVQVAVMRYLHRRRFLQMRTAVTQLQAYCRGYLLRKKLFCAATCIQRTYRGYRARKHVRQMTDAAVTIQAGFRGYQVRKNVQKECNAARTLQERFRAYLEMKKQRSVYETMKKSCMTIQHAWRGHLLRKVGTENDASTKIQACWKGYVARKHYDDTKRSAILIQALVRGFLQRLKFDKCVKACVVIQRRFREYLVAKQCREDFLKLRNVAVFVQCQRRMVVRRREFCQLVTCAVKVQSYCRMVSQRRQFLRMQDAASTIQNFFKAYQLTKTCRQDFLISKGAAMTIQAVFRGHLVRKEIRRQVTAAVVLQTGVRMFVARRRFLALKIATLVCQSRFKAKLACRQQRDKYLTMRNAAVVIQKSFRAYLCRKSFIQSKEDIVRVQSVVRTFLCRRRFIKSKHAAQTVQKHYRAKRLGESCRREYMITVGACINIQAGVRGLTCRRQYKKLRESVISLQAVVRGHLQQKQYQTLRTSTIKIQRRFREYLAARQQRVEFMQMREAATKIQACWKGYVARKQYNDTKRSAILIQALVRGFLQRLKFDKCVKASIVIQRRFREYLVAKQCREDFLKLRNVAVFVQCQRRMVVRRREFCQLVTCAVKIQSYCRMVAQRRKFLRMQDAASTIQNFFKAYQLTKTCRKDFLISKGAAMTIQAVFRGHLVRKEIRRQVTAAVVLQTGVRMFVARRRFLALKIATLVCQSRFKAKLACRQQRDKYLTMRNSAVVIQKSFRAYLCRKSFIKSKEDIVRAQSVVRTFLCRRRFIKSKHAAQTIQKHYRAKRLGESCRREYMITVGACITLQAGVRGLTCRRQYKKLRESVISLQAVVRGHLQQKQYQTLRTSTIKIQRRFREYLAARQQRVEFMQMREAATKIQAITRMHQTRQLYTQKRNAVIFLQSRVRDIQQRKCFLKMKHAVQVLEKYFHAKTLMDECRKQFLVSKGAAMTIQAYFRGHQVRQEMRERKAAAARIQAAFRGYVQKKSFCKLKYAVVVCQRKYRSNVIARNVWAEYVCVRQSVVTLQSAFRGYQARKQYRATYGHIIKLQAAVRGFLQIRRYRTIQQSVITLQRRVRETLASRQQRREFLRQMRAAIVIQSMWRMRLATWQFAGIRQAALVIQANVRCYLQHKKYLRLRSATVSIQRCLRASIVTRQCRQEFLISKGAAMTIQAWYKGCQARRKFREQKRAAVLIQSRFRGFIQQQKFVSLKNAAVVFQRHYRAKLIGRKLQGQFEHARTSVIRLQAGVRKYLCRKAYLQTRESIVTLQAACKMYLMRKRFQQQREAAISIQQWYRSCLLTRISRRSFLVQKGAAITIQAYIKMFLIRKLYLQTITTRRNEAAVKIQSCIRGYLDRRRFSRVRNATVACQRFYRAKCLAIRERHNFILMKKSAIVLQTHFRRLHHQRIFQKCKHSVVVIQSWFKAIRARRHFLKCVKAAKTLQTYWRAELKCRQEVMRYQHLRDSVILIQSTYRGKMAREQLRKQKAVVKLQAATRMYVQRSKFRTMKRSTITVQASIRSWLARRCVTRLREENREERLKHVAKVTKAMRANIAAIRIQRCYRNHKIMIIAKERLHSILVIQHWMKAKLDRLHYLRDIERVISLQSHVRVWLTRRDKAARVIQQAARVWLASAEDRKKHRAALKLQTLWRGHCVRKKIKSRRLTLLRKRVKEATASATEDKKLGNRTSSALDFLLKYKQISEVLMALKCLDVSTRLSGVCCERMVETNAISVLYKLLQCCNRSVPHMEIIVYTISILTNLAKYEKTRPSLYAASGSVDILVELMSIYREKGQIFSKTCTLVGIIALDSSCKMGILDDKKLVDRLRSIHLLTSRKHKLEENQRVTRARMNASSINATFMVKSPVKKHKIKPDWLLHKDKMSDIENPLKAINFVMGNVGLKAKPK